MIPEKKFDFRIEVIFRSGRKVITDVETQTESEVADLVRTLERFMGTEMTKCNLSNVKVNGVHFVSMNINPKELESISVLIVGGLDD